MGVYIGKNMGEAYKDGKIQLMIMMRSGRVVQLLVSDTELGWLYDEMFGRKVGRFQNLGNTVVCIDDIEYLEWDEVEVEDDN